VCAEENETTPYSAEREVKPVDGSLEILSTFNQGDIAIVESVLGDNQIDCMVVGGNVHYDPMRVFVKADQVERALALMRGLTLNFSRITSTR
jgi:hypothetical protein